MDEAVLVADDSCGVGEWLVEEALVAAGSLIDAAGREVVISAVVSERKIINVTWVPQSLEYFALLFCCLAFFRRHVLNGYLLHNVQGSISNPFNAIHRSKRSLAEELRNATVSKRIKGF